MGMGVRRRGGVLKVQVGEEEMFEVCVKLAGGRPPVILRLLLPSLKISDVVDDDFRQPGSFL